MSWTSLTQNQRNQAIKDAGYADLGNTSGGECKVWVRNIVKSASSLAGGPQRNIPSTKNPPNDYMWEDDSYAIGQSTTMQLAPIGWIIQMRLKRASNPSLHIPHTAILYSRDSNGFTFLDSNWLGDSTVRLHYMTFTDFYNKLFGPGQFSGYFIQ